MRRFWLLAGTLLLPGFLAPMGSAEPRTPRPAAGRRFKSAVPAGDWPLYSRDPASTRYSPLRQINTSNVARLVLAWKFDPKSPPPPFDAPPVAAEATPIVVNGVMYLPHGDRIFALKADTGKQIWAYTAPGMIDSRAVGYWPGDGRCPRRIIFTAGDHMTALNAGSGVVDPTFGNNGSVNIGIKWGGAPYVYKNLIVLGANNGESNIGQPGDTRAYDARSGGKLWEFKSIAQPGDPGHDTWLNDGWKRRAGVNVWGWYFSVDEERDLLYMPFGGPAGNYWGGDRPGANLYANSVVAVDAATGKYRWHFQVVHHDLWDIDLPAAPSLFDISKDERRIPAMAVISKNALLFILNRVTGQPVHGVEERPVPKGDAPNEWYSPTQPFPVKPPPLARDRFDKNTDMVTAADTTPEHARACQELWEKAGGFYNAGPFTPFLFHAAGAPPKSTVQFPGNGGPNWGGTSADPSTGYVYVATRDVGLTGWIENKIEGGNYGIGTEGSTQPYDRGSIAGPGPYSEFSADGLPCHKPPWGQLFAINANTGDIAWKVVLGVNERLPEAKRRSGNVGSAGPITTHGGLLFIPSNDRRFRAFDSKTGRELWQTGLDRNVIANPVTYQGRNGRQYVAIVATDVVLAFALPNDTQAKPYRGQN